MQAVCCCQRPAACQVLDRELHARGPAPEDDDPEELDDPELSEPEPELDAAAAEAVDAAAEAAAAALLALLAAVATAEACRSCLRSVKEMSAVAILLRKLQYKAPESDLDEALQMIS